MNNKKISYERRYEETLKHDFELLNQLTNDKYLIPTVKWYKGFCEVSFTINIDKRDFLRRNEGGNDEQQ